MLSDGLGPVLGVLLNGLRCVRRGVHHGSGHVLCGLLGGKRLVLCKFCSGLGCVGRGDHRGSGPVLGELLKALGDDVRGGVR